jgi:hypothetical protein
MTGDAGRTVDCFSGQAGRREVRDYRRQGKEIRSRDRYDPPTQRMLIEMPAHSPFPPPGSPGH